MEEINDLFNKGPVVLFKWKNADGWPVEMVSDNVLQLLGYSSAEIKSVDFQYSAIIHPDDVTRIRADISANTDINSQGISHKPYRLIAKSGQVIWVNDTTQIIRDHKGEVTHYVGYIHDVTSQIEAEHQREIAQNKLRATLASIDELIFVIDENGSFREFYSNGDDENLITPLGDIINKHYTEILEPETARLLDENLKKVIENKNAATFYYSKEVKGIVKHFSVKITPNVDDHSKKTNYTIFISDITTRRQSEIKVKEYYELFSKSNDLLSISNFTGKMEAVNPLWEEKFGFTQDYINQKGFLFFIHPDDQDLAYHQLNRIKTDQPKLVKFDCRLKTKQQDYIWTEWVSTVDYEHKKVYSVTRDISEAKQEQARVEKISAGLFNLIKKSLLHTGTLKDFIKTVAVDACDLLQLDRFTYWRNDSDVKLTCVTCYDVVEGGFIDLPDIPVEQYPNYFKAISSQRITSSSRPRHDVSFEELAQDYLDPHHIKSTMDASIIGDNGLEAVLCAETITHERTWSNGDKRDFSAIADIIRTAIFTIRKNETEKELTKNKALMNALANNMPGHVYIKAPGGRHVYGNNRLLEYFNMTQEEYCKTTAKDVLGQEIADQLTAIDMECVKMGKTIYRQQQYPLDKENYFEEYKFPIQITGQEPLVGGIVIDISERRKAENQIIENEAKYKLLLEFTNAVHWQVDLSKDEFTYVDEKILDLTGYPSSDYKTVDQWADKIHPEDRDEVLAYTDHLTEKGEDHELIYRVIKPSGEVIWIKDSVSVVLENGKPSMVIGYMIDVTEKKNAEIQLIKSEKRFRSLVNDIQVGILLQGPKSEMLLCNEKALELLDLTEDQLLGKTSFDPDWNVIHEDGTDFPGHTHPVPQAIATKKPVTHVIMGVHRPHRGDRVWLHVDATPQLDKQGDVAEVICTFTDVTKRIIAEKEHHESLINLKMAEQIAAIGYWSYDPILDKQVWSDEVYRIYEVSPEEYTPMIGLQRHRLDKEDAQRMLKAQEDAINHGIPINLSIKVNFSPERHKWIQIISQTTKINGSDKYFLRGTNQDVTEKKEAELELVDFTKHLQVLMDVSSDYINMPFNKADEAIAHTLQELGEFMGVDRAYVFDYAPDYSTSMCKHSWARVSQKNIDINATFAMSDFEDLLAAHRNGDNYVIEDIHQVDNTPIRNKYLSYSVISMVTVPMMLEGTCVGLVGIDTNTTTKAFKKSEIDLLRLFAELLVNLRQKVSYESSLVKKQGDLEIALNEKDTLFKELHHRIKNNLQLISSVLFLKLDKAKDPDLTSFINETIARILSISKIHDQLLKLEEVYELDIKNYLEELTHNIIGTYCENPALYQLNINVDKANFHIDDALVIGLLVNESVSNIIKYAYPSEEGGEINIDLSISPEARVSLTIGDKGKGLPFNSLDEASQSNGIQLICVFVEQLRGTIRLRSTIGTSYNISFDKRR